MTMVITREKLRGWGACYSDEEIAELVPPGGIALEDVLHAESVPPEDRVWVATRPGVLDESLRRRWLGRVVRRALDRLESPDPRSLAVLEYLDRGELVPMDVSEAAYAAAAPSNYISSAAYYASIGASDTTTTAATYAAYAYSAAASAASYNANAERRAQVADLLSLLR